MKRVAIIGGVRTPFVKAGTAFANSNVLDLGICAVEGLVEKLGLKADQIDELVYSTVLLNPRYPNFAREIVLRSSLPDHIGAHSVSNNCISGLVAINKIADAIRTGRIEVGIGGGVESMSRPALLCHPKAEDIFLRMFRARTGGEKLKLFAKFRPKHFLPQAPSPKEPSTGLTMGQHMELTAQEMNIAREIQDKIALASHVNAARAQSESILASEIVPHQSCDKDNLIRPDTSIEKLAKLKPVFDRSEKGTLTAGNSSALTDGASAVCLMSEERAKKEGREILAYFDAIEYASISPDQGLLMAPAIALPKLMQKNNLNISNIDLFEVHEAFGAQVAANMQAWENGWDKVGRQISPIGKIPEDKMNVNGGSVAIGHPFAATGGRLVTSLANSLKRNNLSTGVISVCAAGAMAAAVVLRRE